VRVVDDARDPIDPGVTHRLVRDDVTSSRDVAAALSTSVDVVLVEHEFGIFGGPDGLLLRELTDGLRVPYALTLHTVTGRFTASQRAALDRPMRSASAVLVFSDDAAELLRAAAPSWGDRRCRVVPHGAPAELYATPSQDVRSTLGFTPADLVITTFGLLSPGKGIEHAIDAAGALRHVHDDVVYVVAGRTHPEVVRRRGEQYRDELRAQVHRLGLEDVVVFRNWFHDVDELAALLACSDVFLTPYADAEQIVSGALSFAVAAGVPFVSTPYRYARDLARRGCGLLVPFADPDATAAALKEVLTDRALRARLSARAREVGADMSWPEVGRRTAAVLADVVGHA
jgi:glycosyltransferase involved in cell wall biosynthesis